MKILKSEKLSLNWQTRKSKSETKWTQTCEIPNAKHRRIRLCWLLYIRQCFLKAWFMTEESLKYISRRILFIHILLFAFEILNISLLQHLKKKFKQFLLLSFTFISMIYIILIIVLAYILCTISWIICSLNGVFQTTP